MRRCQMHFEVRNLLQMLTHDHVVVFICLVVIHEVHCLCFSTRLNVGRSPASRVTNSSAELRTCRQWGPSETREAVAFTLAANHGRRHFLLNVQLGLVAMNVS